MKIFRSRVNKWMPSQNHVTHRRQQCHLKGTSHIGAGPRGLLGHSSVKET